MNYEKDETLLNHIDNISSCVFQRSPEALEALQNTTQFLMENQQNISNSAINASIQRLNNVVMAGGPLIGSRVLALCGALAEFGGNPETVFENLLFALRSVFAQVHAVYRSNPGVTSVETLVQRSEEAKQAFNTLSVLYPAATVLISKTEHGLEQTQAYHNRRLMQYAAVLRFKPPSALPSLYSLIHTPVDEQVTVMVRSSQQAFRVRISKVVHNNELLMLLQHHLSPYVAGVSALHPSELAVLAGDRPPMVNNRIPAKWDLKQWTCLMEEGNYQNEDQTNDNTNNNNNNNNETSLLHWMKNNGNTADILEYPDIGRVVILDPILYPRSIPIKREFPFLRSSCEVMNRFSDEEYSNLIHRLSNPSDEIKTKVLEQLNEIQ